MGSLNTLFSNLFKLVSLSPAVYHKFIEQILKIKIGERKKQEEKTDQTEKTTTCEDHQQNDEQKEENAPSQIELDTQQIDKKEANVELKVEEKN